MSKARRLPESESGSTDRASEIAHRLAVLDRLLEMGSINKAERNKRRREILAEL